MEEIVKEQVLDQDFPGSTGEQAASPPAQDEPQEPPEAIPYARFVEVNTEKNRFKTSLEEKDRQIEMLTQEILRSKQPATQQVQTEPVQMPVEPRPEDFEDGVTDRDYIRALNNYDYQMNKLKDSQEAAKNAKVHEHARNLDQHRLRAAQFIQNNPDKSDYLTVAERNPVTSYYTDEMKMAITASPKSPEIAYYLGKNPAEAIRIAQSALPAMEIGMIAAKLSATESAPKKVSLAPDPIEPVGNINHAVEKSLQNMSMDEYRAKMNRREMERRKAGNWGR